jgi:DNA mismatch repair protein MSH6
VAFVDTTIGIFNLGQFSDDKNLSRLRTLAAHYPPAEVLHERAGLSAATLTFLAASLPGVRREVLRPSTEFWDSAKTLKCLAEGEYFRDEASGKVEWPEALAGFLDPGDSLGLTASSQGDLAVRALGALVWYLKQGEETANLKMP